MVVIVVLAVVSGYFIGSYIAGSKLVALSNTYNELVLREITDVETRPNYFSELPITYRTSLLDRINGKTPDKVNGIYVFMMSEYNTNTADTVSKTITGNIKAKSMGINVDQKFIAHKSKADGNIYFDKISYSGMAKVALKIEHTIGSDTYKHYKGNAKEDLSATWEAPSTKPLSAYREAFGSGIDYMCNYLVTPKTVQTSQVGAVKAYNPKAYNDYYKTGLTYYEFDLLLDIRINESTGEFVYGGVSNYMYEIKSTANANDFPVFSYCKLHVVVDGNYRLVQIDIEENYQIIAYGFNANTTAKQTEMFKYE